MSQPKFLIIGSVALNRWFPDSRTPGDLDIMSNRVEAKVCAPTCPSKLLIENSWFGEASEYMFDNNVDRTFLDANFLLTLKASHACYDIHFAKTIGDIDLMVDGGTAIDMALYTMLRKHWVTVHGVPTGSRIAMNVTNEEFFSDYVSRDIPHDMLHELVADPSRPANESFRKNMHSPLFDDAIWNRSTHDQRVLTAFEEMCVIAIERFIDFSKPVTKSAILIATSRAYRQLVTTMTKGTFNLFLILNHQLIFDKIKAVTTIQRTLERISALNRSE